MLFFVFVFYLSIEWELLTTFTKGKVRLWLNCRYLFIIHFKNTRQLFRGMSQQLVLNLEARYMTVILFAFLHLLSYLCDRFKKTSCKLMLPIKRNKRSTNCSFCGISLHNTYTFSLQTLINIKATITERSVRFSPSTAVNHE